MNASNLWTQQSSSLQLLGVGSAFPGAPVSSEALLDRIETNFHQRVQTLGRGLARRLKIHHRHFCRDFSSRQESPRPGHSNPELCATALRRALEQAGLEVGDLGYLIGHTATPAFPLPSNISQVASLMGYPGPFAEFRQACTGFVNAAIMASGLLGSPGSSPIAIVGSETGSVFCDPGRLSADRGQLVNLMQMGDGAGAIIVGSEKSKGVGTISSMYHGQVGAGRIPGLAMAAGGSADPTSGGHRILEFAHDFQSIRENGLDLILQGLAAARQMGQDLAQVDFVIPHQANGLLDTLLAPHLPPNVQVVVQADEVGNTGSAAIWLALEAAHRVMEPGQKAWVLGAEATQYMFGGFHYVRN